MKQRIRLTEAQLKRLVASTVKKVLNENNVIRVGTNGGYYGSGSIFSVYENDGETEYVFSPSGWDYTTQSQFEAAAICASANDSFLKELINNPELSQLKAVLPSKDDVYEAVYWLTGGNREWNYGMWSEEYDFDGYNEDVFNAIMADDDFRRKLNEVISQSSTFTKLIVNLRGTNWLLYAAEALGDHYIPEYDEIDDETGEVLRVGRH